MAIVYLRLPPELVERLRACAHEDARSLNAWCVLVLEHAAALKNVATRRNTRASRKGAPK
jgi:hypothetical protein